MSLSSATAVAQSRLDLRCLGLAMTVLLGSSQALAQGTAAVQPNALEEVVVGSHLAQPAQALAVTVITQDQIQQRGFTTAQQVLDGLAQNSGGGFDQQANASGSTPAASSLNLRDLGVGRALILLNGRRLPMYPVGVGGTDSFVDTSSIPVGVIERIEVLTDGASAVYGSDALSGVVNIVLKKNPVNEVSLRRTGTTQGGGDEQRWQLSTGARNDDSSVLFTAEYYQRKALWFSQRERTRDDRLGGATGAGPGTYSTFGYPGIYTFTPTNSSGSPTGSTRAALASGCAVSGICIFNRAPYRQIWPDSNSLSTLVRLTQKLSSTTELFLDALVRKARTNEQYEPQSVDVRSDLGIDVLGLSSVPNNPFSGNGRYSYQRRLVELGPSTRDFSTSSYVVTGGLKGERLNRWNWELSLQSSRQRVVDEDGGLALISDWQAALTGQRDFNGDGINDIVDLTQHIPDTIARQLGYTAIANSSSSLSSVQWLVSGDLLQLAHGPLRLATVADYTRERYVDTRDPQMVSGNVIFNTATSGSGARARSAVGVEVQWPLLPSLQLNMAGRYDQYQDASSVGGAFSPRLMLQFKPIESWQLRASVGRNFRAPDMQRLFGGSATIRSGVVNTPQCVANGGTGRGDVTQPNCVAVVAADVTTRANRDLSEEHGVHYSFGTVWQPISKWSISLDYFMIDLKDLVQRPDLQYVLDQNAANGSYSDWITLSNDPACQGSSPRIFGCVAVDLRPINIAYKKTSGLDLQLDGKLSTALGTLSVAVTANYLLDVTMRESSSRPPVDVLKSAQLGEAVRFKGGMDLGWELGRWRSDIYVDHVGAFTPLNTTLQKRIGSFTTVNMNVSHTLPTRTTVRLGVNNIFNREPPIATYLGNASVPFYHTQFHNLDGATWFVDVKQGF